MSEPVELRPAYAWTCPECGTDHFCNGIVVELSPEEVAELREQHGVESHATGDFMTIPTSVTCPQCYTEFETMHFHEGDL